MPQMSKPIYCSQQIIIPPTLPHILKVYAKAAIKTQPYDLLTWSAAYFRAMADGKIPPMKFRLEYPLVRTDGGLTAGYLRVIIKQFSGDNEIEREILQKRWHGLCLKDNELRQILCTAGVYKDTQLTLYKFVAVAAGFLCKSLTQTMIMLCELFSDEPEGGSGAISADLFVDLYTFLAAIDASKSFKYIDGVREDKIVKHIIIDGPTVGADETPTPENISNEVVQKNMGNNDILTKTDVSEVLPISSEPSPEVPLSVSAAENSVENIITGQDEEMHVKEMEKLSLAEITGDEVETEEETPVQVIDKNDEETGDNNEVNNLDSEENEPEEPDKKTEDSVDDGQNDPGDGGPPLEKKDRPVTLRVFSEEGDKIDSLSAMSLREKEGEVSYPQFLDENGVPISRPDITVKEMEAVIEQLQRNKDEKVKDLEATMDSLEDLVEKTKMMTSDVDALSSKRILRSNNKDLIAAEKTNDLVYKNEQNSIFTNGILKIPVDPNAKGVVNPIFKGLFDNVADQMGVIKTMQEVVEERHPETIIVPGIPGIGPIVDEEIVEEFLKYIRETAAEQCDMFMPRDIRHCLCPPLEKI